MEAKKTIRADLESKRPVFFQVGLLIALLVVYLAFEFVGTTEKYENIIWGTGYIDEEIAVLHLMNFPPPPSQQATATDIKTVADEINNTEDFTIDVESHEDLKIDNEVNTEEEVLIYDVYYDAYYELHGGDENYIKLIKFLQENLIYPKLAREVSLEGKVYVEFTIEKNGHLTNFIIVRSATPVLDNEVLRVLQLIPKWEWKPKENKGKYVRAHYQIPIVFVLE